LSGNGKGTRWVAGGVLVCISGITAVNSYVHSLRVVEMTGTTDWTAYLTPFVADLLVFASSLALYDSARSRVKRPMWAVLGMALGVSVTGVMNVASGWQDGLGGSLVAAWSPTALFISYEVFMSILKARALVVAKEQAEAAERARVRELEELRVVAEAEALAKAEANRCPHVAEGGVEAAIKQAFLHGRDCLGQEPSIRGLADSFQFPRPQVAAIVNPLKPENTEAGTQEAV
jgi:hypothetical protein